MALEAFYRYPQVEGLVLLAPWVSFPWLAAQLCRAAGCTPIGEPEGDLERALAQAEPKALFDRLLFPSLRSRMHYEWIAEASGLLGSEAPALALQANGLWRLDYTPLLRPDPRPIWVLVGEEDGSSYPYAEEVASYLEAPIAVIPGAGHYPWLDAPETFEAHFREALGRLFPERVE